MDVDLDMNDFFSSVTQPIPFEGPESENPLAFRWYDADRLVAGKPMRDHLRFAVCYWHSFAWDGFDIFGQGTLDRPWIGSSGDAMDAAKMKMAAAFEFFEKLGTPFYCFHNVDIAPPGDTLAETAINLDEMATLALSYQESTGVELLWGTANLFSEKKYMAGAATNPDPEVFAHAAGQICHALETTHRLGGRNYVMWGGREGYETLLNTDYQQEREQLGRMLALVVEHKHKIGFDGPILLEPKPFEPTKHQYDFDVAACDAFLQRYDLVDDVKLNIEVNHATLSGHDFDHEIAAAFASNLFGSIDANAGDDRLGWDVDRFPVSVEQMSLGMYQILRNGGFTTGGLNFDSKLRRQSIDREDLFYGHIGGMDVMARSLLIAAELLADGVVEDVLKSRYQSWTNPLGQGILGGSETLESLRLHASENDYVAPASGRQEHLENVVRRYIEQVR